MPLPLIPIGIAALATAAYGANKARQPKTVDPKTEATRAVIYDTALNTCKDSAKLRELAKVFHQVGKDAEATMLMKRAALIDAPPELKKARRESLDQGMVSTNKQGILVLANAFEEIGATAAAAKLRQHASTLDGG
jgi:hypothetical protein